MPLSSRDRAILDFEREWWALRGPKDQAIRDRLALSPAHYYKVLSGLLDSGDALAYDPLVVRRLRKLRDQRRRVRWEGRPAGGGK
jgi:uncharacterized protein DUF3263